MLAAFWIRIQAYAIGALAALAAGLAFVALVFRRGERAGRDAVIVETQEKTDEVRRQHDEIDARTPDFDAAIGRLRHRAGPDRDPN
jgi:hypothetical protein